MMLLAIALLAAVPSPAPERLALTISGGVSLGNYEAGLTWAIVRYLRAARRRTELAAVTGASAGAVNALLAAIMWCEDESETRDHDPDENLFHDAWAPVGLEDLLPEDRSAFVAGDGLLAAAPLEGAVARIRSLFEPGGRRFRPGCSISVGWTVTRDQPEQRNVSGLIARTQRFVIPLRLEVDADGRPRLVEASLAAGSESASAALLLGTPSGAPEIGPLLASQAILASGAFPFAFRSRELCDCALDCPDEDLVPDGSCEGPDATQRTVALSCASVPPAGSRQLCRRRYLDGGIFDNAPIGVAVDLTEASGARRSPFLPITYIMVDPDVRRLEPHPAHATSGLAAPVELIRNLIGTARETELARTIRSESWQRTTQSTLADAAQLHAEMTAVQEEMASIAGGGAPGLGPHPDLFRSPRREALGWFLLRCLSELQQAADPETAPAAHCAEPLRDRSAGVGEPLAPRLTSAQIVQLAGSLAAVFTKGRSWADRVIAELGASSTPMDRRLQLLGILRDGAVILSSSFLYLTGEVPAIRDSGLSDAELLKLRGDLLAAAGETERLLRATTAMLQVFVSATLLEEGESEGETAATAAQAREGLAAGFDRGMESAAMRSMAAASERISRLVALAPRLRTLSAKAATIAANAAKLSAGGATERRLGVLHRFPPLGGGQLFNFSGFLDRGLRDLDFYLGAYDAAARIATFVCETQGPYPAPGRAAPVFRDDAPLELDLSSLDTQRCIGAALREVAGQLQISRSTRAAYVIARLARIEVTAQLGSRASGAQLLDGPSWSWLGEPKLSIGDPTGSALAAVTSQRAPCRSDSAEQLCLADPTFAEFLSSLKQAGFNPQGPSMREALADRERWAAHLTAMLMDRMAAVELQSAKRSQREASDELLTGVGLGELWSRRAHSLSASPAFDVDPSSLPARSIRGASPAFLVAAHLLPYRVSLDVVRGGVALSWLEPALRVTSHFSIESIADVLDIDGSGRLASKVGLLPAVRLGEVMLGAGAQEVLPWNGDRVLAPGLVGRIAWLQERLALTGGIRSTAAGHRESFVSLSVSDLNGLAYWLALWAARRE